MILKLQQKLSQLNIDYFLVPSTDQFLSEYPPDSEKRLQFISGFSGSNGYALIGKNQKLFLTDGRYIAQAKRQLENDWQIDNVKDITLINWLQHYSQDKIIGIDDRLFSKNNFDLFIKNNLHIKILENNPIDEIWQNRPKNPATDIYQHDIKYAGIATMDKRKQIAEKITADIFILTDPTSICWLLNIRANDCRYIPLVYCYAIFNKNTLTVDLFVEEKRIKNFTLEKVNIFAPQHLPSYFSNLSKNAKISIAFDASQINNWLFRKITNNNSFAITNPCMMAKAIKNATEIKNFKKFHNIDGQALSKFIKWLKIATTKESHNITEISASKKLLNFRKENIHFKSESFAAISGFAENGAIIHYSATKETNKKIIGNNLYLIDSGGQYYGATTDVTRTIAIGKATIEQIKNYTLVLKGHIKLAMSIFPTGTTGSQLDAIARYYLWQEGLNYDHGTGHGVGCFLSVHEGPQSISLRPSNIALKEGMILSNEPGYYKDGEYGIRIENLVLVVRSKKYHDFLEFETLTKAPLEEELIDYKMLDDMEKKWLSNYISIVSQNQF